MRRHGKDANEFVLLESLQEKGFMNSTESIGWGKSRMALAERLASLWGKRFSQF